MRATGSHNLVNRSYGQVIFDKENHLFYNRLEKIAKREVVILYLQTCYTREKNKLRTLNRLLAIRYLIYAPFSGKALVIIKQHENIIESTVKKHQKERELYAK